MVSSSRDIAKEIAKKYNVSLTSESLSAVAELISTYRFKHRKFIQNEGDIAENILYIEKGLLRLYRIDNEEEILEQVVHENDMLISYESLFTGQPTSQLIQTIEPTIAHCIPYKQLKELAAKHEDVMNLVNAILENCIIKQRMESRLMRLKPTERYKALLYLDSEAVRRTPLKYIATYLDMAAETLSRVRSAINNNQDDYL